MCIIMLYVAELCVLQYIHDFLVPMCKICHLCKQGLEASFLGEVLGCYKMVLESHCLLLLHLRMLCCMSLLLLNLLFV